MPFDQPEDVLDCGRTASASSAAKLLLSDCTTDSLVGLLRSEVADIRGAAAVCLGLRGSMQHCGALSRVLWDEDVTTAQLAENSLWQIWMRAGSPYANAMLVRAIDLIRGERFEQALRLLTRVCGDEPTFAEPHDQRGIALCFLDEPAAAADAFRRTLRLNRYHFSAATSLAHTFVERSDLRGALRHYRYALRLHPRLDGIPEVVGRLEAALGNGRAMR